MANDRVTVTYGRTVSQGDKTQANATRLEGTVSFDLPEGTASWMDEYTKAYALLREGVDGILNQTVGKAPAQQQVAALPGEKLSHVNLAPLDIGPGAVVTRADENEAPDTDYATYDESAQMSDIDPNRPVKFTDCRVFNVEVLRGKKGPWAKVRIGNREQIPGQYITAKSFDPEIVQKLKALEERDMIDVWGRFAPWKGVPDKYDLMVEGLTKR